MDKNTDLASDSQCPCQHANALPRNSLAYTEEGCKEGVQLAESHAHGHTYHTDAKQADSHSVALPDSNDAMYWLGTHARNTCVHSYGSAQACA
eukprot:scaffold21532_cov17-Tisochrysis_lutea.AAC.2